MPDAAGSVNIVLSVNKANFSAAMAEAQTQLDKFAGKTKEAGHATVTSMQASSAAIRGLENPLGNNLRAVERFITTIPGVGKVLQAAFPLVGGIAFGGMIVEMGMKVAAFIEKANQMPKAIQQGFASMHLAAASTSDSLKLANDNLQNSIDKLQGKPQNNLAIQLDEARVKADELAKSLENDAKGFKSLLEQNKLTALGGLLTGKAGTSSIAGSANFGMDEIAQLGKVNASAVRDHGPDSPEAKKALKDLSDKQAYYQKWITSKLFLADNPQYAVEGDDVMSGNQAANRNILLGFRDVISDQQGNQAAQDNNGKLTAQNKGAEAAHAAALKAAEARKKEAAEFLTSLETNAKYLEMAQKQAELIAKLNQEDSLSFFKTNGVSSGDNKSLDEAGKASLARITAMRQSIELNKENSDAIAESSLQMAVATGQITRMDAARVLATMHQKQYADALAQLQDQASYIKTDRQYNGHEEARQAALLDNANRQSALGAGRSIQAAQDSQNTNPASSSGFVGAGDALDEFVIASRDAASQMRDLVGNTLSGLNQQLVGAMSGQRTQFGNFGAGMFRSIANTGLQKAEGSVLGMFGFGGGKMGTQANPMWTKSADGVASAAGGLLSKLGGTSTSKSGGFTGFLSGVLNSFIPHAASGGFINGPTLVGEDGPELFSGTGQITPNHKLVSSGSTGHTIYVDATGSTDPAQTRVQVMRGIQEAAPHIAASTISSQNQDRRRTPSSQRKS
ncbi:MAG: hypothetical protein JWQ49_4563 [Edaphobacter sp.]|nr:hypothetical protein [Edaphobacter sp.]